MIRGLEILIGNISELRIHESAPSHFVPISSIDVESIRHHFLFPERGRVPTNNAASTQPPVELLDLYKQFAADYENVHRGQSDASRATTKRFEESYDTISSFINAPGRENLVITRNATEAHNTLMYCLLTEFRDGDNVVATMMEHNSNYVPWYGMCKEILPKFGITWSVDSRDSIRRRASWTLRICDRSWTPVQSW